MPAAACGGAELPGAAGAEVVGRIELMLVLPSSPPKMPVAQTISAMTTNNASSAAPASNPTLRLRAAAAGDGS